MLQDLAAQAFDRIGAAHHRIDTSKHPAMHKTDTIDYIILLKGDVSLLLDEEEVRLEPFDTVVQRGTNHAWVNHCLLYTSPSPRDRSLSRMPSSA